MEIRRGGHGRGMVWKSETARERNILQNSFKCNSIPLCLDSKR